MFPWLREGLVSVHEFYCISLERICAILFYINTNILQRPLVYQILLRKNGQNTPFQNGCYLLPTELLNSYQSWWYRLIFWLIYTENCHFLSKYWCNSPMFYAKLYSLHEKWWFLLQKCLILAKIHISRCHGNQVL